MTGEVLLTSEISISAFTDLTPSEQFKAIKGLLDSDPIDRLTVIGAVLDSGSTRIRTLCMDVLAQTADKLPDEVLYFAERYIRDKNDRVSAAAIKTVGASIVTAPEKAIPVLEYAFTRRAPVREAVGNLVVKLFEADQNIGLPFLIRMAEDKPNSWRHSVHIERVICGKPELFDLENSSPSTPEELEVNQWRKLLEKQLAVGYHSAINIAAGLIKEAPELALNVLVLAEKIEAKQSVDEPRPYSEWQSQVGLFLISRFVNDQKDENIAYYYDQIQLHPEAKEYLDRDIEWIKSNAFSEHGFGRGRLWLSACKAIPELKDKLSEFFADRTRRISDTSEEYTLDRAKLKEQDVLPEIFGIGAVDVPGMETPKGGPLHQLGFYKVLIEHMLEEDKIQRRVSQATLAKLRYLKSLLTNGDPEEVNDERLRNFFQYHVDEQMAAYRESLARIPEWQERFLARLPANVDRRMAQRRIEETRVVFFDELSALTSWDHQDAGGTFDDWSSISRVDLTADAIDQEKIYTHEMLHALSGRSLLFHPRTLADSQTIINQRVGFRVITYNRHGSLWHGMKERFRWLNEAVTEDLAQEMMSHAGYSTYHEERELLRLLQTGGRFDIDTDVIRNAYFENFNTDLPPGERLPHWKRLQKQLHKAYGEPILVKLDNIVHEFDVRAAMGELYLRQSELRHTPKIGLNLFK